MLKKLFIFIIFILLLLVAASVAVIYVVAEDAPRVARLAQPAETQLAEIRNIIQENKPSKVLQSGKKELSLTAEQLNTLMAYVSQRFNQRLNAHFALGNNRFFLNSSLVLPDNPVGKYINIESTVRVQLSKYFVIEKLKLGKVTVPSVLVTIIQPLIVDEINARYSEYVSLWRYLRRIDINNKQLTVHYRLERSDLAQIKKMGRKALVNSETKAHLLQYTHALEEILVRLPVEPHSVSHLLTHMFIFAQQQSEKSQKPVEENRMALLVLAAYMMGRNPANYVSEEAVKPFKKIEFTLKGRSDLAQHYLVSAGINAISGTTWSNTIGLEKELSDSDGGSGFSFIDLMADIAGNKLAVKALDNKTASELQRKIILLTDESSIMGRLAGLQEGITEKEFRLEYGNTNTDEYMTVVREIERRLFRCDVYR